MNSSFLILSPFFSLNILLDLVKILNVIKLYTKLEGGKLKTEKE